MKNMGARWGWILLLAVAGCTGNSDEQGQSEFKTPAQAGGSRGGPLGGYDSNGASGELAPGAAAQPVVQPTRAIEESDIYKLDGTTLYVLNRWRGLQIIDVSDLDAPRIIGRAPIYGYPKEMYVRGTNAYVIVSDYYNFWCGDAVMSPYAFYGSQLYIVDIANPASPSVAGAINIDGEVVDSRIVGDIMYLVSSRYAWYNRFDTTDTEDKTVIHAVAIANPASVHLVQTKDFPRDGWEDHIMVTPQAIYIASSAYVGSGASGYQTNLQYVDISDPTGTIRLRGTATVNGQVLDRWSMDEYAHTLRVASGQMWGGGDVHLTTFSVANPDAISQLGQYTLQANEQLTAARFDGTRGYLVSTARIDPQFVFNLSDPAHPVLLSELQMTGWLDFIVPQGDRLVALGHDQVTNPNMGTTTTLAVSLIDVSQPTSSVLLSRVNLGESWGWVPGDRDDFAKVFKVLPSLGLIILPYQSWSSTDYHYSGGVQLIDYSTTALTKRGLIQNAGWVERGVAYDDTTVLTISSEIFQIMNITDRDQPALRSRLELARDVHDFALISGNNAVQLTGDWYLGDMALTVTPQGDPNASTPLAQLHVPAPYGQMFVNGDFAYVISNEAALAGGTATTKAQVVDLTDPAAPQLRGSVFLPEAVGIGYHSWYWGWGDEVLQISGNLLAFHRSGYWSTGAYWDSPDAQNVADKIFVVDLSNPDAPSLASTIELTNINWAWGLKAAGKMIYLSSYRLVQQGSDWYYIYYLNRIDATDPTSPTVLPAVNIPGGYFAASPTGQLIYTLENWWDTAAQKSRTMVHALALVGNLAYLRGSVEVPGYVNSIIAVGSTAFLTSTWWDGATSGGTSSTSVGSTGDTSSTESSYHSAFMTIDLSDAQNLRIAGQVEVPYPYAMLKKVANGQAFISSDNGIFTYAVTDAAQPLFRAFHRTQGWVDDIVLSGNQAFLTSGYYGVQVFDVATP